MTTFFTGFSLSLALIMAIGAQNLFVLRQGLKGEHVFAIVLFCATVDGLLIFAGVTGLGAMIAFYPSFTLILTVTGAVFLIWYGVKALQRMLHSNSMSVDNGEKISLSKALTLTAAMTLLNPHVYLDTVVLIGAAGAAEPENMRALFILGGATASFMWFTALGFGAKLLVPLFKKPLAWRILDGLVALTMFILAAQLLYNALRGSHAT